MAFSWIVSAETENLKTEFFILVFEKKKTKMLPSELESLPQSVRKYVWSIKFLKESLGLQNETQVREWFYNHPNVLAEFEKANREIDAHIKLIQNSAKAALQYMKASEHMNAFQPLPQSSLQMALDYEEETPKRKKIKN